MRVLLAEGDLVASTSLQRMLRSFGHEVEAVRDGLAAWKRLEKEDAAPVAILDGMLPGKGALEIAGDLRSRRAARYTYIITLAPTSDHSETVAALEAGADGNLALPVSPAELAAHLKAAERIIQREQQLQNEIAELRQQIHSRQALEVQLPGQPPEKASPPPAVPEMFKPPKLIPDSAEEQREPATALSPELPVIPGTRLESLVPMVRMQHCFETILRRIRYAAPAAAVPAEQPELTVYSAVVLEDQRLWLDLKMEVTHQAGEALYHALMSEAPGSDADLRDALAEVCNMSTGAWKTVLESAGLQPITVGWPDARRTQEIPQCSTAKQLSASSFGLPGGIRITLIEQFTKVLDKPLASIEVGDVLADPLTTPGHNIPLLKRGTTLTTRYIERIRDLLNAPAETALALRIIEPSPLALCMRRRWPRFLVDLPLTILAREGGKENKRYGRLQDISENGAGATLAEVLNVGQTATLGFTLAGETEFLVEAVVRHRSGSRYGFEFLKTSDRCTDKLRQAIRALMP